MVFRYYSTKLVALLLQNSLKLPARAAFEKYETRFRQGLDNYKTYIKEIMLAKTSYRALIGRWVSPVILPFRKFENPSFLEIAEGIIGFLVGERPGLELRKVLRCPKDPLVISIKQSFLQQLAMVFK